MRPGTASSRPAEPGFGYVDERTPELAIAVVPSKRGRGIGDALLRWLLETAGDDGYAALSLCVDSANAGAISSTRSTASCVRPTTASH